MKINYFKIGLIVFTGMINLLHAEDDSSRTLTIQQWNVSRNAETLLRLEPLKTSINEFAMQPNSKLHIYFPGGDEGTLWARELRAWLVSLGVDSDSISLIPGSSNSTEIKIKVVKGQE